MTMQIQQQTAVSRSCWKGWEKMDELMKILRLGFARLGDSMEQGVEDNHQYREGEKMRRKREMMKKVLEKLIGRSEGTGGSNSQKSDRRKRGCNDCRRTVVVFLFVSSFFSSCFCLLSLSIFLIIAYIFNLNFFFGLEWKIISKMR